VSASSSTVNHAQKRERSILAFFATSIASRGLGIGCQLFQVPISLHLLGNEAFGLWVAMTSVGYILAFTDFGIGLGVQNRIAESLGRNDREGAQRNFVTGLVFLSGIMLLFLSVLVPACLFLDLPHLLRISDPAVAAAVRPAMLVVITVWCLNIPIGLGQRLAYGAQLGWAHNIVQAVSQVSFLAAVALGAWLRVSISTFFVMTFASGTVVNFGFLVWLVFRLGWQRLSPRYFQASQIREIWKLGIFFFLQQIAAMALFTAPSLILSGMLGAGAVTPYNLTQRVLNLFTVVANAVLLPTWPAFADAKARDDWAWIRRTLWRSVGIVAVFVALPMVLVGPFVPKIISWWTRGEAALPPVSLVWMVIAWNAVTVLQQPFGYFLSGISEIRRATLYSFLSTVAALGAIFLFIPKFGVNGVPAGLVTGFVPFIMIGTIVESVLILRRNSKRESISVAPELDGSPQTGAPKAIPL
jgi:O-antigen/teichoic acid export membrane protein